MEKCEKYIEEHLEYPPSAAELAEFSGYSLYHFCHLFRAHFGVPVVFAKKTTTNNIAGDVYTAEVYSYTHERTYNIRLSKDFLTAGDRVLIIDDFLAKGSAMLALLKLVEDAGASVAGAGIVIEKAYQPGGKLLRDGGLRIESLAKIASMDENGIIFED
jgi:xanthine phosphoribosyltransferase